MTASNPNLREELNLGVLQRLSDVNRELCWGDLLARLIVDSAADETAIDTTAGTAGEATLAAAPSCILDVIAQAGVFTGRMTLVIDPRAGIAIPSGTIVWDGPGTTRVRFNLTDAITDLDIWYTIPADTTSLQERILGQIDGND